VQGEARQGLLVLIPSEGAQQPLQQALEGQGDERCHLRFQTASATQIEWFLSQQPPTGESMPEDFEVDCIRHDRPPTPRDAAPSERILRYRQQADLASQVAAGTMEDASEGAADAEIDISATPDTTAAEAPASGAEPASPAAAPAEAPASSAEPASPAAAPAADPEQPPGVAQTQAEADGAAALPQNPGAEEDDEAPPGAIGEWVSFGDGIYSGSEESA